MKDVNLIFQDYVNRLLENNHENVLYFFKGFAGPQIQYLLQHPQRLYDLSFTADGHLDTVAMRQSKRNILINIISASTPLVGFYEELLLLFDVVDLPAIYNGKIVVIENNIFSPWCPSCLSDKQNIALSEYFNSEHKYNDEDIDFLSVLYTDINAVSKGHTLLLPRNIIKSDSSRIEIRPFWNAEVLSPSSTNIDTQFEVGTTEDSDYRFHIMENTGYPVRILHKEGTYSYHVDDLQKALSTLEIPFIYENYVEESKLLQYDDSQFLPLLQKYWGPHANFRKLLFYKDPDRNKSMQEVSQGNIIAEIVDQCECAANDDSYQDIFITAPTGAGKSILFQIPALYLAQKYHYITVVISPLIALMQDQVEQLEQQRGITCAAFLNSSLSIDDRMSILKDVQRGRISLLYLAPELLLSTNLETFLGGRKLGLMVIDEAHTVTSWGRDFRSDYWFLGDFLRSIHQKNFHFPVLCLTATAVYSGSDDIVNDTIHELGLSRPIVHLGNVKRNNIVFDIQSYPKERKSEREKCEFVVEQVRKIVSSGEKTLAYFPFKSQVEMAHRMLKIEDHGLIRKYHGQLAAEERSLAESDFKCGNAIGLFCTKAFGMGIDVSDIQHVIHFAPSGTLADYIQEIGRAARDPNLCGIAHIAFFSHDISYIAMLNRMSEMRQYQLRNMLKKLWELYSKEKHRNLLISAENFEYLFNEKDVEAKTKNGLLLLSKDLLNKYSFPVLIVKPRSMLSKNYVIIPHEIQNVFLEKFGCFASQVSGDNPRYRDASINSKNSSTYVRDSGNTYLLDMKGIWEEFYSNLPFGFFKKTFFETSFDVRYPKIKIAPRVQIELKYNESFHAAEEKMVCFLTALESIFSKHKSAISKEFTQKEFETEMISELGKDFIAREKFSLILDVFTAFVDEHASSVFAKSAIRILQKRKGTSTDESVYLLIGNNYLQTKSAILRMLRQCVPSDNQQLYRTYSSSHQSNGITIMPLLKLLELLELASYEIRGGEKAEVFIRINDPEKIRFLASGKYVNNVLRDIQSKHENNRQILKAFFTTPMNNEDRWNLIEDYFLGHEDVVRQMLNLPED